jgi:hypothetical protein
MQETGFFKSTYPDSSYRVTFSHVDNFECQDLDEEFHLNEMVERLEYGSRMDSVQFKLLSAERFEVDGRPFGIIAFRRFMSTPMFQSTMVWGFVRVDSINLQVEYECARKNCEGFVQEMTESLRSIRVN